MSTTEINQRVSMLFLGLQNLSAALLAEKRDDDARTVEGMALQLREMARADAPIPKQPQRRVVWMAERTVPLNERPTHVWALPGPLGHDTEPTPPDVPIHGRNAWYQDVGHDWSWLAGRFRYSPGGGFEPCWLLLEYEP